MFHLAFILVSQPVKTQAVLFWIDQFGQLCFEQCVLGGIQKTLKYRILYPLPMIHASFGYFA